MAFAPLPARRSGADRLIAADIVFTVTSKLTDQFDYRLKGTVIR